MKQKPPIADDAACSKDPFITAKSLKAGVELNPLVFSMTLHITGVGLGEPQIILGRVHTNKTILPYNV